MDSRKNWIAFAVSSGKGEGIGMRDIKVVMAEGRPMVTVSNLSRQLADSEPDPPALTDQT